MDTQSVTVDLVEAGTASASAPSSSGKPTQPVIAKYFIKAAFDRKARRCSYICRRCDSAFPSSIAKAERLVNHLLSCPSLDASERRQVVEAEAGRVTILTADEQPADKKRKQSDIGEYVANSKQNKLPPELRRKVDQLMLRFFVTSKIPFRATNNPFLDQAFAVLRPGYATPSDEALRGALLQSEYCYVVEQQTLQLQGEQHITIALDGWTDYNHRSLYAWVATLSDGSSRLLKVKDLSDVMHTGAAIAGA